MKTLRRPETFRFLILFFAVLLACVCPAAAGVIMSPHDLYRQGYLVVEKQKMQKNPQCEQCHLDPGDDRPLIWQVAPQSMAKLGMVGTLCASCHDGVSMVDRNVDAGITVFHPASHGLDPAMAPSGTRFDESGILPLTENLLSCLTCHDPHESQNRPFLRVPFSGICQRCHKGRKPDDFGVNNTNGDHPVDVEPFDNSGGATPISVESFFSLPFPKAYPLQDAILSTEVHWRVGGHLGFGSYGKVECSTCHAMHGNEGQGPVENLLAKDPVRVLSDEFCEGCHQGKRGDDNPEPPFPNPGGTTTGRTYHPADDDEANDVGWNVAIADTIQIEGYIWGGEDPDTELPRILCTTCHRAHGGMENSPGLVHVSELIENEDPSVTTFCEICHRDAPPGHHGYGGGGLPSPGETGSSQTIVINTENLGHTYGSPEEGQIYCSHCHRAHNAGYNLQEELYIPILVEQGTFLCELCHSMGVSHFLGDPTLPSNYNKPNPSLKRDAWPSGLYSVYEGQTELPTTLTCLSCHTLSHPEDQDQEFPHLLLAPADEAAEWTSGNPAEYLCTGCHGEEPATVGGGVTHPLITADSSRYPEIRIVNLWPDEIPVTYTENGGMNCHSCHVAHNAVVRGGVFILKIGRGTNVDPKAIRPLVHYSELCDSCHPYL